MVIFDYDIRTVNYKRGEIKKKMSKVGYNTNRENTKKTSREALVKELKAAKEELIKSAQDEQKKESTGDHNMDKVRSDRAAQILLILDKDILPTPKTGNQEDPEELNMYEN